MIAKGRTDFRSVTAVFCDCGSTHHTLIFQDFDGDVYLTLSLEPQGLWNRLKMAIRLLAGGEHELSDGIVMSNGSLSAIRQTCDELIRKQEDG